MLIECADAKRSLKAATVRGSVVVLRWRAVSERHHRSLRRLEWRVVGCVVPACVRKAEQSGCGIGTLGDMPAKSLNRVA